MNKSKQKPFRIRHKKPIDFGRQRRSYLMHRDVVIDHVTGKTVSGVKNVLDGDLDSFATFMGQRPGIPLRDTPSRSSRRHGSYA